MYKMARRAVKKCLDNGVWDSDYKHPEDLQNDLEDLNMGEVSESIRKGRILDYLEEIYWNACISLTDIMPVDSFFELNI